MSGIIPDGMVTITISTPDSGNHEQIPLFRFPTRVRITGVSFVVDYQYLNNPPEGHMLYLQATKYRRPRPDPGVEYLGAYANGYNIWTSSNIEQAPHLDLTQGAFSSPLSTIGVLPDRAVWDMSYGDAPPYEGEVAQMDPDEWIEVYLDGVPTRTESLPAASWVAITMTYTGATNLG